MTQNTGGGINRDIQRQKLRRIVIGVMLLRLPGRPGCKKSEEEVAGVFGHVLAWGYHGGSACLLVEENDGRI